MCPQCRAFVSPADTSCPYCQAELRTQDESPPETGQGIGGWIPPHAYTTFLLLVINAGLWIGCVIFSMHQGKSDAWLTLDVRTLILFGGKWRPEMIPGGQWWRLVTAAFLHGGFVHILVNSAGLLVVGAHCEQVYGIARYLAIYVVSSITGFLFSLYFSPGNLSIGASAPLMGLVGALIALAWLRRTSEDVEVSRFYVRLALMGTLINIALPIVSQGVSSSPMHVDHAAHAGGIVGGALAALLTGLPDSKQRTREWIWRGIAGGLVVMTLFGFVRMYEFFDRLAATQAYRGL